ncbi:NAD-dependent epimerase/dehydratase family protein [Nocardioides ferulae]|uniref:NAD-dependent epimerase/dehydratase family protein n=1 Tax=Nocardioides ferulae TaxID=2340821 RepID=UPI000EB06937|nr:NAD-dependent epimerase/dehydratase family protein [Nocardioides ferulae]
MNPQQHHLVLGAGPVGRSLARLLADRGEQTVLVSRSGGGPELAGVRRVALDVTDADALAALADGAVALYNCVNPPDYTTWVRDWPPMAAAMLTAAERSGAVLAITGNLYPYGPVTEPMVEELPDRATDPKGELRARIWADALAAHRDGRVRAVEVRGSDYVGPGVGDNGHVTRVLPRALAGRPVRVLGSPDQPHSWTDVRDVARTLAAVAARPDALGRVWHVPTDAPRSQRQAIADMCAAVGRKPVAVRGYPRLMLDALALGVPMVRELRSTRWQFEVPYVLDSSAAQEELGLRPTPWEEVCRATGDDAVASVAR